MTSSVALVAGGAVLATATVTRFAIGSGHRARTMVRIPVRPRHRKRRVPVRPLAPRWVVSGLDDAGLAVAPDLAWSAWVILAASGAVWATLGAGPGAALVALVVLVAGPALVVRSRRGEAGRRFEAAIPVAMESIARSLRTGASMRQAIAETASVTTGHLGIELKSVAHAAEHGGTLVGCLDQLAARRPLPGVRLSVAALCLGIETGGAQARAIDGVATTLRDRLAVAAEVQALSSQARISALVIGLAPLGFGAFAVATDQRTADFLLNTGPGWALVASGLFLDAVGWIWMRHICQRESAVHQ